MGLVERRTDAAARGRAFELALLLSARAKELGLPYQPWRQRAGDLAAYLPPEWRAECLLAILDALPLDASGFDRNTTFRPRRPDVETMRTSVDTLLHTPASSETKAYFEVAAICAFDVTRRNDVLERIRPSAEAVPLLAYAVGSCTSESGLLSRAMTDEPRFVDAAYPLGRHVVQVPLTAPPELDAMALLAQARSAFPQSAAITYTTATLHRQRREWQEALTAFDATLQLVPTHHDARLGRVMALSNLARHEEAIAGATGLIDEGTWLVGDAYFWRAWNAFQLDRLDASEADVERAKKYLASSSVYVLSGAVQWRKQRPTVAEAEFVRAVTIDRGDCDASTYLGSVRAELRTWSTAAEAFTMAETCRDNEAAELRKSLDELLQRRAPSAAIENQRRSITTAEQQSAEMAFNRGVMAANAGDATGARVHLERAARHPALQDKSAALLQRLRERH